jgi:hypothetical protein
VTAESEALLEEYVVWRQLGAAGLADLSARQAEAFLILADAWTAEARDRRGGGSS